MDEELELWQVGELWNRRTRRSFGLVEFEDETGGMIPGMYVVYAWHGDSLNDMCLGGGQVLFDNRNDADLFCDRMDYKEVTENMTSRKPEIHQRWTVHYIPFGNDPQEPDIVKASALESRIQSGEADPITAREKALAAKLKADYKEKYGPYKKP